MSILREELNKYKQEKNKVINESAVGWVKSNVILITEKINRRDIERLVGAIDKFQQTFEPYYEKIPSIKQSIEDVDSGLHLIITGKKNGEKATDMLKYMSFLYNTLSNFFKQDIATLLKTSIFAKAAENPDTPMKDLINSKDMVLAFKTALKPDNNEIKLLKAIYKNAALPELNVLAISQELINLSLNELKSLQNVEKVPLIATEEPVQQSQTIATETVVQPQMQPIVAPVVQTESKKIITEDVLYEQYLNEAIDLNQIKQMTNSLRSLKDTISGQGLVNTERALDALGKSGIQAVAALDKEGVLKQKFNTTKDFFSMIGNSDAKTGQTYGAILKQIEMAIKTFEQIKSVVPDIQELFQEQPPTPQNVQLFKNILLGAIKEGGVLAKIASFLGTKPYPGLEPAKIVDDITKTIVKNPNGAEQMLVNLSKAPTIDVMGAQGTPSSSAPPNPTTPTQNSQPTGQTKEMSSGEVQQQKPAVPAQALSQDPAVLTKAWTNTIGGNEKMNANSIARLIKAGWKLMPPQ